MAHELGQVEAGHLYGGEARDLEGGVLGSALALARGTPFAQPPALLGGVIVEDVRERVLRDVLGAQVLDAHDAPDTAREDLGVLANVLVGHDERLDAEIGELRDVQVAVFVQAGAHLSITVYCPSSRMRLLIFSLSSGRT